jgi:AcrR family transcriptional regulator
MMSRVSAEPSSFRGAAADAASDAADVDAAAEGAAAAGKRRALLDAAARILAEEGPPAVSVRRVAAAAGTSTMAVYTWYGGKPQLMQALFHEAFSRFRDRLLGGSTAADPLTALIGMGRAYRAFALAEPDMYTVMFGRTGSLFDPGPEDARLAIGTFEILVAAMRRCVEAGILHCDPQRGAWQVWAACHGAISLELAQRSVPGGPGPGPGAPGPGAPGPGAPGPGAPAPGGPDACRPDACLPETEGLDAVEAFSGLMRTMLAGLGADEASVAAVSAAAYAGPAELRGPGGSGRLLVRGPALVRGLHWSGDCYSSGVRSLETG